MTPQAPRRPSVLHAVVPIAMVVLAGVIASQTVSHDPRLIAPLLALTALLVAPVIVGRRRMRKLLMSGDVERLIVTWEGAIDRVPHRGTVGPLLAATAYAAYGWIDASRRSLERAMRGPAWDAAFEQRLFVETLLDAFEGDREAAVRKAAALERLPLPRAGLLARRRVAVLRRGLGALARAFAHASREGDGNALAKAASASPLVHWAMRYAAAIVAIDGGRGRDVPGLLSHAPAWPKQSAFSEYHDELLAFVDSPH
jgi:hypothetical protein